MYGYPNEITGDEGGSQRVSGRRSGNISPREGREQQGGSYFGARKTLTRQIYASLDKMKMTDESNFSTDDETHQKFLLENQKSSGRSLTSSVDLDGHVSESSDESNKIALTAYKSYRKTPKSKSLERTHKGNESTSTTAKPRSTQKRALHKRKEIRTAEDRKRALAKNLEDVTVRKSHAKRPLPDRTKIDRSSESSSSSPDVEVAEQPKKPRRATPRKCPVEQIDVDCEMGHRPYMEDALVALQDITAYLPQNSNVHESIEPTSFFGVYDGHGGFQASRYIQKFFHVRLLEELKDIKSKSNDQGIDMTHVLQSVYRRVDHDYLNHCNVHAEGIPPLLNSRKSHTDRATKKRDHLKKTKRKKNKNAEDFTSGAYVQRIMDLQKERVRDRGQTINILKSIPTSNPEDSVTIDDLIRDPSNFKKLDEKDARAFSRFLERYKQTNGEAYQSIRLGKTDFRKTVQNPECQSSQVTETWSETAFTSDEAASEFSGVDSDIGVQSGTELEEVAGDDERSPPLKAKDDPMTRNPVTPGSTVCVCLIDREHIYSSWVGDSEAVLYKEGGVTCSLTNPHSPLRDDEWERIRKLGGVVVKQSVPGLKKQIGRVQGQLSVSRAIGDAHLKRWVLGDPEVKKTPLTGDEEFAVIASDGLWDVLSFKEVYRLIIRYLSTDRKKREPRKMVRKSQSSGKSHVERDIFASGTGTTNARDSQHRGKTSGKRQEQSQWSGCARYLIRTALTCGSSDNISVIVIFFKAGIVRATDYQTNIQKTPETPDDGISEHRRENERRGLFSGVGLFKRARIRRVFARNSAIETGSQSDEDEVIEDNK